MLIHIEFKLTVIASAKGVMTSYDVCASFLHNRFCLTVRTVSSFYVKKATFEFSYVGVVSCIKIAILPHSFLVKDIVHRLVKFYPTI